MSVTREAIRAMLSADPSLNNMQVAKRLGLSRERVRKVRKDLGLPPTPRGAPAGTRKATLTRLRAMLRRVAESDSALPLRDLCDGLVQPQQLSKNDAYRAATAANAAKRKANQFRELLRREPVTPYRILAARIGIAPHVAGPFVASLERVDGCNYREGRQQLKRHPLTVQRKKVA